MVVTLGGNVLVSLVNPFVPNTSFSEPESNFIERGISSGIEKGFGAIGDRLVHAGQLKAQNLAQNLPELAGLALVCYYCYVGYKTLFKPQENDLSKIFPVTMVYIIFRMFFKLVLGI